MITEDQRNRRHLYIGGSDVPIIMGKSKFKTPWELLLEKAQLSVNDFGGNIYSHLGSLLEPKIQDFLDIKNVDEINYEKTYDNINFECHIDGLSHDESLFYEIKVANQSIAQCYESYEWQIRTYMYATGLKKCNLVLLNRNTCGGGYLKKCVNYVIKYYDIDYLHDFNKIDFHEQIMSDINVGAQNLVLHRADFKIKEVHYSEEKEQMLLEKVAKFWDFKEQLVQDPTLKNDLIFKTKFLEEFN